MSWPARAIIAHYCDGSVNSVTEYRTTSRIAFTFEYLYCLLITIQNPIFGVVLR